VEQLVDHHSVVLRSFNQVLFVKDTVLAG